MREFEKAYPSASDGFLSQSIADVMYLCEIL